ncbi:sporulation-specific diadenylate cyclase CdaS [Cohnella faecalis]|uniref:DAC domain-containing protein n=1 Tax=Cohnella faecalis TaxID=2315694 RepID=A0A398CM53_9BACL|nr:sporulation-specific diadenylate cyclase CdaS [Cohnella faecalis]RIE03525.1 hypothetical protein D3H35_12225 [Cohnella faecalis]
MERGDCDFSPLRLELKEQLSDIHTRMGQIIASLDEGEGCLLNEMEHILSRFTESGALASTYYLRCFLSPYTSKYNEISRSIQHLCAKKQGALLVIQREKPVEPWMTPGIPLAADITSSLLDSIFVPASPLHDGAVYIRSDKIVSAANVLPLTRQSYGEKKLGTRHRAAIGLSELTDALTIVVSEETGKASFCLDGKLFPFSIP